MEPFPGAEKEKLPHEAGVALGVKEGLPKPRCNSTPSTVQVYIKDTENSYQ